VAAVGAAFLLLATVILVVLTGSDDRRDDGQPAPPPASGGPGTLGSARPSTTATPTTPPATGTGQPPAATFRFLPLWPFGGAQEAASWQAQAGTGGHQPWRLDAASTALVFTSGFLGFGDVDRTFGVTSSGDQAWVKVGYPGADGHDFTAAEVHLARIGAGANQPWEVVGTRDTTLTLTGPRYGATVTSPVTMSGRITGVDESLRLQVRALTADGPLGETTGIAAGGQNEPWTGRVTFAARTGTVLTLVVSTGGHAGPAVERFAIMGVRAG
jgi:hypothetical protein